MSSRGDIRRGGGEGFWCGIRTGNVTRRCGIGCRKPPHYGKTGPLLKFLIVLVVVAIAGGVVFLATWDIPAPTHPVEKVIPNDRFTR